VAYAGAASTEVPLDLAAALRAQPRAQVMFDILTSQTATRSSSASATPNSQRPARDASTSS
jgi:uncharacterized protein YdeI (YjbR/CyaY-like superfamily)